MLTTIVFMQYGLKNKISAHIFNHHQFRLTEHNPAFVYIVICISLLISSTKLI